MDFLCVQFQFTTKLIKSLNLIQKRPTYDVHKLVVLYDVTNYFKDTTS